MAYMNQERKAAIAAELKKVIPAGWKYSLAVRNHTSLVLTISAAPVDLCAEYQRVVNAKNAGRPFDQIAKPTYFGVNPFWLENQFDGELLETFQAIKAAMYSKEVGYYDRSDIMTDYFDTAWYVDINIGRWDKPFQFLAPVKEAA